VNLADDLLLALDPVLLAARAGVTCDQWQADLLTSEARDLILLCSRQSGKSSVCAVKATHEALYCPASLTLIVSPSQRQSGLLYAKIRALYAVLGDAAPRLVEESSLRLTLANGSSVVCLPGREETIRGYSGATLLLVDEAALVPDAMYVALRPMLAVSGGRVVLLSTPRGRRGFFYREWTEGGSLWHRAKITAYECPRIPRNWLEGERERIGRSAFNQEYLVEFVENEDSAFAYDDVEAALDPAARPLFDGRIFG